MAQVNAFPLVVGGLFIGIWLFTPLVDDFVRGEFITRWYGWGMVGLMIAATIFALRYATSDLAKALALVGIGLAIGGLIVVMIIDQNAYLTATLITALGGGLVGLGIPQHPNVAPEQPAAQN